LGGVENTIISFDKIINHLFLVTFAVMVPKFFDDVIGPYIFDHLLCF
jgi:hypothetical protein